MTSASVGLDDRRYGPLRDWTHFKGLYRHANRIVIAYTVGESEILESHLLTDSGGIARILNIGKSEKDIILRLANTGNAMSVDGSDTVKMVEKTVS